MMDFLSLVAAQFHIAHFLPVEAIIRSQKRDNLDLIPRGGNGLAQDFRVWFFKNARQFDGSGDGSQLPDCALVPDQIPDSATPRTTPS